MTIKVTIENCEKPTDERGNKNYARLRVTVLEVGILDGKVQERSNVEEVNPGEKRTYHVYSARSLRLDATNSP